VRRSDSDTDAFFHAIAADALTSRIVEAIQEATAATSGRESFGREAPTADAPARHANRGIQKLHPVTAPIERELPEPQEVPVLSAAAR
jgi:hypothetical protein